MALLRATQLTKTLGAAALLASTLSMTGCFGIRLDMHDQPKYKPLRQSSFYADERASRPLVEGTVSRGNLRTDELYYTGKINGVEADQMPFAVTPEVLARGRERFNIYCSPCHSRVGDGRGMIVQRGFKKPPDYTEDKLMKAPVGHFFNVMTNGFGSMGDYSAQVPVNDRWAIAAYIRVLQLARKATPGDVPPGTEISNNPPALDMEHVQPVRNMKGTHGESFGQGGGNPEK